MIIGTAGHVDHGKTNLIKALTGIDADRLNEEKRRGLTIDLGFAHMDVPNVGRVGIIDVPGHEKYIKNMLSGIYGVDICLLVIAADEGIMPQTKEHIDILEMLEIQNGITVITKIDLIDDEDRETVVNDIVDELKGSIVENNPIVAVSTKTGKNIEKLKDIIYSLARRLVQSEDAERENFLMPIDRAFVIKGFGTVITGTAISGKALAGEEYIIYPDKIKTIVRGIQTYSDFVDSVSRGSRAALNVKDVAKEDIKRGQILATKGSISLSLMVDVKLTVLRDCKIAVHNNDWVYVYIGTGEYRAKVVLIKSDIVEAADTAYAQLRFETLIATFTGQRFIIRCMNPSRVIGGGRILDSNPSPKRRKKDSTLKNFEIKDKGTMKERACITLSESSCPMAITTFDSMFKGCAEKLVEDGTAIEIKDKIIDTGQLERLWKTTEEKLAEYHNENPSLPGISCAAMRAELLGAKHLKDSKAIFEYWIELKKIKEIGLSYSLYEFEMTVPKNDDELKWRIADIYQSARMNPPAFNDVKEIFWGMNDFLKIFSRLQKEGVLIKLDERYYIHRDALIFAKDKLYSLAEHTEGNEIVLGEYRDRLKSSRKVALALLEYFDSLNITVKQGEVRFLTD